MLPYAQLVSAVASAPRATLHGPWARTVEHALLQGPPPGSTGTAPEPLWPGGSKLYGARFTPAGSFPTLYLAASPVTAMIEVGSIFSHPSLMTTTIAKNPVVVVSVDGMLNDVVDLTDSAVQALLGTTSVELTASWVLKNPAPTQELGRAAYEAGVVTAFKFPSSKHETGWCLAIFTDRLSLNAANYVEVIDTSKKLAQRLP